MRSEPTIFDDLAALCISKGFIHALATICLRDNIVGFAEELTTEDMAKRFSRSRLIRTEVTTLIGLMMRAPIDYLPKSFPTISSVARPFWKNYTRRCYRLRQSTSAPTVPLALTPINSRLANFFANPSFIAPSQHTLSNIVNWLPANTTLIPSGC